MKSKKLLTSFTKYCEKYPDLRFWQALVNWCGKNVYTVEYDSLDDVFYRLNK